MRTKRSTFSQKIMERKRSRRIGNIASAVMATFIVAVATTSGYQAWHENKRNTPDFMKNASLDFEQSERVSFIAPVREVPNRAIVNGQAWDFIQVDHFADSKPGNPGSIMAETDCENLEVTYLPSDDKERLRENIMHEIFHAGACLHGGDVWWNSPKDDDEHPGIYHLGEFMHTFLHDNRQFAEWLGEE